MTKIEEILLRHRQRALDEFCAEHVMGFRRNSMGWSELSEVNYGDRKRPKKIWLHRWAFEMWRPTTNEQQAFWVLVKCLSTDKLSMPIEMDRKRHKAGRFRIETGVISNSTGAIEDTLPMAVCCFAEALFKKEKA